MVVSPESMRGEPSPNRTSVRDTVLDIILSCTVFDPDETYNASELLFPSLFVASGFPTKFFPEHLHTNCLMKQDSDCADISS